MKHWVFDLDGTLVDSFSHFFSCLSKIFDENQAVFTADLHIPALTQPLTEFFERHLGSNAVSSALDRLQERCNEDAKHILPFTGAKELLKHISEQDSRIAIWTNRDLTSASLILEHSGLSQYVDICVSGTCTRERKPHPEGLLRIIERFNCTPDQVTMVGDHDHDVIAAKAAGTRAIRASWHSYWPVEPCTRADAQFHQLDDLVRMLRSAS